MMLYRSTTKTVIATAAAVRQLTRCFASAEKKLDIIIYGATGMHISYLSALAGLCFDLWICVAV